MHVPNTQNYNRYSYVLNNPLKYTDPTGNAPASAGYYFLAREMQAQSISHRDFYDNITAFLNTEKEDIWLQYSTTGGGALAEVGMGDGGDDPKGSRDNPVNYQMKEVVIAAKRGANQGGGLLDRAGNYLGNVATAAGMTIDWALGTGANNRTFVNDNVAGAFRNANRVNEARDFYYNKFSGAKSLANTSVTGYKGSFGLSGLWNAGLDPIEQFVGTYRINIYNFSGNTVWFVLTNQTSMNSFLYDLGPSWQRSTWGPGGNMNQTYMWSEPVRK